MVSVSHGPIFTQAPASGLHEVMVLSPDHQQTWAQFGTEQTHLIMGAIRDRIEAHAHSKAVRYSQVIVNQGKEAGASMAHPHAQLLGISFVPRELADELEGFSRFVGGCLLCETVSLEEKLGERLLIADQNAAVISPYWAASPFELLVIPRDHAAHLHHAGEPNLNGVGTMINQALAKIRNRVGKVAYNVVFHSSPYRAFGNFHWHVHIYPKLTTTAGFELGTGVPINIVSPEVAIEVLGADSSDLDETSF
jgi:UDPglucose--hexose-1-phosphate uridylyltransferase